MKLRNRNELIQKFLNFKLSGENLSPQTLQEYEKDLSMFFVFMTYSDFPEDKEELYEFLRIADISSVTIDTVRNYTFENIMDFISFIRITLNNSPTTTNRRLSCLKSFYTFCHAYYKIDNILADKEPLKTTKNKKPLFLTDAESEKLMNVIPIDHNYHRNRFILSLALNGGLRVEEIHDLKCYDIKDGSITFVGKGNKERSIPMNDSLTYDYEQYMAHYKLQGEDFFNITIRSIQRMVKAVVTQINRPELSIHSLRHTFATQLIRKGVDLETIRDLMGHSSIATTQIYLHTDETTKKSAVSRLDNGVAL